MTEEGTNELEFDYFFPAELRWLEEGGPKIKPKTERDSRGLAENHALNTGIPKSNFRVLDALDATQILYQPSGRFSNYRKERTVI